MQVVRPVVDFLGPRLERLAPPRQGRPRLCSLDVRHPVRAEHPQDLVHRHVAEVLGHDEVHQVVDVGQVDPVEAVGGDLAVEPDGLNVLTGLAHVLRVAVQPLHKIPAVGPQSGGQLSVAAAEVYDQPALDARFLKDCLGRAGGGRRKRGHR